ncbi:MAG: DEAD/DEAH box helicase [Fusobacteriia bacterium 4572_132]|nr:MAG: DEAD/DEAH box helicase [Fusobacteriia bacterium 4572_132]
MFKFTEDELEKASIQYFEELGYEYIFAPTLAPEGENPERNSYADIILEERLREAIYRVNPKAAREAKEEAIRKIIYLDSPSMIINNKTFHKMITDGIDVTYHDEKQGEKSEKIFLFDFKNSKNNEFLVLNQFTIIEAGKNRRPDLIIFINGLPLVVIELKSAINEETTIHKAYNQFQTYKKDIPSLFNYNSFLIISDGVNAKAGTITSNEERFMNWRTIDGKTISPLSEPKLEVLIKGIFKKDRLLDIIKNYILFQTDGEEIIKILSAYHQYFAVKKAVENTKKASSKKGDRRIGVVWHTQGSGKSLSMVFYAGQLIQKLDNPTIVVLTDRNDLDEQLFQTFSKSKDLLRQIPKQAKNRKELRELLSVESGGIVFTTIQKFTPGEDNDFMPVLTERENVIVIADEAHRSQYGLNAKTVATQSVGVLPLAHPNFQSDEDLMVAEKPALYNAKNNNGIKIKYGYAKYMREAIPNASFIGFTGTPIEMEDKSTPAVFGNYIDVYDMTQAVEDKATVKIYYENRIIKLIVDEEELKVMDDEIDDIMEGQEEYTAEKTKTKWGRMESIVGAKERVKTLADDIVKHFEMREKTLFGKSMVVCMSRRICIDLYDEIVKLRPNWQNEDKDKGKIKIVMTGSASDPENWQKHIGDKKYRRYLAKRMKDNDDELKIVLVRDMWLTGFDVPSMHTMYIDKPMSGHNLMQAIARVNRVFKDKEGGLVVDYLGIAESLKMALKQYTESDRSTTGADITKEALYIMIEKYEIIKEIFYKYDYDDYFLDNSVKRMRAISGGMNFILEKERDEEGSKKNFIKIVTELAKAHSLCVTTDKGKELTLEISYFKAVKASLVKLEKGDLKKIFLTEEQLNQRMKQIVSNSIISEDVIDVFSSLNIKKPDISIMSKEFLEEIRKTPHKNLAVELLKRLLMDKVKVIARSNLIQSRKFSDLIQNAVNKYKNKAITNAEVIEELLKMANEFKKAEKEGENLGLSKEEFAFYQALTADNVIKELMENKVLIQIAHELSESIRKSMTVDWAIKESARATMRRTIKRLLRKYKYPPENQKQALEIVMKQAKLMCGREAMEL